MEPVYYFSFQTKTTFIKLQHLFPECGVLIEGQPELHPLKCLLSSCPANANCMEGLVRRLDYFFENVVPQSELIVAYFRYADRPQSIRAGIFYRDMTEPRVAVVNPWAFRKFQKEGDTFKWFPPAEFYRLNTVMSTIIPVESLIKKV